MTKVSPGIFAVMIPRLHEISYYKSTYSLTTTTFWKESEAWPAGLDFVKLQDTLYKALEENLEGFDPTLFLRQVEGVFIKLGVMPFDEKELPPEDPGPPEFRKS